MADLSGLILTGLGLAFEISSTIYNYLQDIKAASNSIQRLSSELFALIGVLEHMKLRSQQQNIVQPSLTGQTSDSDSLTSVLEETLIFLKELKISLEPPQSRRKVTLQRLKWPLKDKETQSHLQRLERVKTYFILSQVTDNIDRTRDIAQQITALTTRVEESRLEQQAEDIENTHAKISEWLAPIDPRNTFEKVEKHRVAGSGAWFISSKPFQEWVGSRTSSTFWLNGITGSGKTTLIAKLNWSDATLKTAKIIPRTTAVNAVHTKLPKAGMAYFYCSFTTSESLEETIVLGSLLSQLYRSAEKSVAALEPLYKASGGKIKGFAQARPPDAKQLAEMLIDHLCEAQDVYILIDGINECTDPDSILLSLQSIVQSCENLAIHVFVSSIDEKGIGACMETFPDLTTFKLRPSHLDTDIGLLIQASLDSNPRLRRHSSQLKLDIQWALVDGAHGMFRWVQCQLDILSRLRTPGAVREALTKLPPTLDKTYEGLLQRIASDEDKALAREILEILAFTYRPLRLQEVSEMLQITSGLRTLDDSKCLADPLDILSICGSLLTYQKDSGVVALAHHSVMTYLTSELHGRNAYFRLSPNQAHKNLAIKCLAYLSFDAFSDGPCPSASFRDRYSCFSLLGYAAHHWAFHVGALESLDDSLWQSVKDLLFSADEGRGNFHAWVQVLIPSVSTSRISQTPPLYYAASFGLTEVVRYLLDAGADIEVRGGYGGATPLNIASFRGHYDVVKLLLDHGANPHAVDHGEQWSAIQWAGFNNHREVSKLLTNFRDGVEDTAPPDRKAARADSTLRRQWMRDLRAPTITVANAAIAALWAGHSRSLLWWGLVALAECQSDHPFGRAITTFVNLNKRLHNTFIVESKVLNFEAIPGGGVFAIVDPQVSEPRIYGVLVGNRSLIDAKGVQLPPRIENDIDRLSTSEASDPTNVKRYTLVFVAIDEEYAGCIALADERFADRHSMKKIALPLKHRDTGSRDLKRQEDGRP